MKKETVLVGISGGVDSAVCALKLKQEGYNVIGAMMKVYDGEVKTIANSCYGADKEKEIRDARKICEIIDIPFYLFDCAKEFDSLVFEKFKEEYKNGRTPNPCVMCNPLVKFGAFPRLARDFGLKFDKFATGHYARIEFCEKLGKYLLKQGLNDKKDQSYFLYGLSQEILSRTIFPLGGMEKEDVRAFAKKNGLIVHDKTDSQDFYKGDYAEIICAKPCKGDIVHISGQKIGTHEGIFNYTIGQRKGLKIAWREPLYVISLDCAKNTVVAGEKQYTFKDGLFAKNLSWTYFENPPKSFSAQAKIRSAGRKAACRAELVDDGVIVKFDEPQNAIAAGQAVVFYDNDIVLGGGVIEKSL